MVEWVGEVRGNVVWMKRRGFVMTGFCDGIVDIGEEIHVFV